MISLTAADWFAIAMFLVKAEPDIVQLFSKIGPELNLLIATLTKNKVVGASDEEAADYATFDVVNWLAVNGEAAIRTQEQLGSGEE